MSITKKILATVVLLVVGTILDSVVNSAFGTEWAKLGVSYWWNGWTHDGVYFFMGMGYGFIFFHK